MKIINTIIVVGACFALYYLNQSFNESIQNKLNIMNIVHHIADNETLSEQDLSFIKNIKKTTSKLEELGPECFLLAYYELSLLGQVHLDLIDKGYELDGIDKCGQYIQLAVELNSKIPKSQLHIKANDYLQSFSLDYLNEKYSRKNQPSKICIMLNAFNSQSNLKENLFSLGSQIKQNMIVFLINDGSQDDTFIYLKYYIEEMGIKNVTIKFNSQRKGIIQNYHEYMETQCKENDIVLLLDGNEKLMVNSIELIQKTVDKYQMTYFNVFDSKMNIIGKNRNRTENQWPDVGEGVYRASQLKKYRIDQMDVYKQILPFQKQILNRLVFDALKNQQQEYNSIDEPLLKRNLTSAYQTSQKVKFYEEISKKLK